MTIEGKKISFEGAAIFSVLEGFYQHFLVPKRVETTLEWGSRSATMTLINLSVSCSRAVWADSRISAQIIPYWRSSRSLAEWRSLSFCCSGV